MATGTRTTATDSNLIRPSVGDMIHMIDWTEAPLLRRFGLDNATRFRLLNWPQIKYEWLEDTMSSRESTLAEALDASETGIDVADGTLFKRGSVVKVESELMYVSSVASNTLTVSRGYAGSTAATHATSTAIYEYFQAQAEGAEFVTGHTTTVTRPYNYTQIFSESVIVTRSEQKVNNYAVADTMAYHLSKLIGGNDKVGGKFKAGKFAIQLGNTFYHGLRHDGSSSLPRAMGGFNQFVSTNVTNAASASLTRKMMDDAVEAVFLAGGDPDCIICNTWPQRKFAQMYEGFITTERSETMGGNMVTKLQMPWGGRQLDIIFDRWCPSDQLFIVESDKLGWVTFDKFAVKDGVATGDYMKKDVVGEYGFVLVNEKSHGRIHTFSTTS